MLKYVDSTTGGASYGYGAGFYTIPIGTTYFVEVSRVQYVDKVIETPHFFVKAGMHDGLEKACIHSQSRLKGQRWEPLESDASVLRSKPDDRTSDAAASKEMQPEETSIIAGVSTKAAQRDELQKDGTVCMTQAGENTTHGEAACGPVEIKSRIMTVYL